MEQVSIYVYIHFHVSAVQLAIVVRLHDQKVTKIILPDDGKLSSRNMQLDLFLNINVNCVRHVGLKVKVHPTKFHEGTEREQLHCFSLSFTSALDGGGWLTPRPGRFTPGNDPLSTIRTGLVIQYSQLEGMNRLETTASPWYQQYRCYRILCTRLLYRISAGIDAPY